MTFVTAKQLATELLVTPKTVKDWALAGIIPSIEVTPRKLLFDPVEVERAIRKRRRRRKCR